VHCPGQPSVPAGCVRQRQCGEAEADRSAATNAAVETEIAAWFDATSLEEEKAAARRLNKAGLDHALFAPLGVCMRHYAWRKSLTGITQGPLPLFWGVSKTV